MITGRRNFLRLTSAALAGVAVNPTMAVTTNKDFYLNRALGLAFYKPSGWYFLSVSEVGELKNNLTLADEWEGLEQHIWESTGEPICVIAKLDQTDLSNKGKYSPSIVSWAYPKSEFGEVRFASFELFCDTILSNRMEYVKDWEIKDKLEPYDIDGIQIREYHWEYTLIHEELQGPLRVQAKMLFAEHGNYYYIFDFVDSLAANENADVEFEQFRKNIMLM